MDIDSKASKKAYKVGDMTILGTTDDFRESPVEAVSGGFEAIMERNARGIRRRRAKNPIEPMRNRFDRMKSYYFKRGMDWNLDFDDFLRLWETAPDIWDEDKRVFVPAKEYADRRGKLRVARKRSLDRYISYENACLKLRGVIFHSLSP